MAVVPADESEVDRGNGRSSITRKRPTQTTRRKRSTHSQRNREVIKEGRV